MLTLPLLPSLLPGEFLWLADIFGGLVCLFWGGMVFFILTVLGIGGLVLGCVCGGCEGQHKPWGWQWVLGLSLLVGSCLLKA